MKQKGEFFVEQDFLTAGKGLWYLFLAEILALAGVVVIFVPVLGPVAAFFMVIAGAVLEFVGPYVARDVHPNFRSAFYAALVGLVIGLVSSFVAEGSFLGWVISAAGTVVGFLTVYFICTAAEALLVEVDGALADRARLIWKLYGGCAIVEILAVLLGAIPVLNVLVGIAHVVVSIAAYIMLIVFYYQAARTLKGER